MRIIKKTQTRLILQNRDTILLRFILMLLFLASLGFLFSGLSSPVKDRLICHRNESKKIHCSLTKSYLSGRSINEEIKELKGAAIKEHHSGKNRNYEVVLQTDVDEVSLLTNADGGSEKLASFVNDFVALPQQSTLQLQTTAWGYLSYSLFVGLLGIGVTSGAILVVSVTTCTFDKSLNQVVFKEKSLIKNQEARLSLSELLSVKAGRVDSKAYQIILVFKKEKNLRLVTGFHSQGSADKIVGKIQHFLDIKK